MGKKKKEAKIKEPASSPDEKQTVRRISEKVKYSFLIPEGILAEARSKASDEGTTVTRLIVDGLKWRLKQDS